ncbi:MAG: hypothetical protein ABI837_18485 [Acidobacteriota bacterium]
MARRLVALLGILVVVSLLGLLMWRVYLHHNSSGDMDEPTVVRCTTREALLLAA